MTDDVVQLSFTDNPLYGTNGLQIGSYSGTLSVDYTTNTVISGSVTVTYNGGATAIFPANSFFVGNGSGFGAQYVLVNSPGSTSTPNGDGTQTINFPNGDFQLFYNGTNPSQIGAAFASPGFSVTVNSTTGATTGQSGTFGLSSPTPTPPSVSSLITEPVTSTQISTGTVTPLPPITAVCYAAGTLIRTCRGEAPVEELRVGDLAITSSGETRAIVWLGHRVVDCANHPDPIEVLPIRIAADAFGPGRPSRDLLVSPGHSICVSVVDEVLIQASRLVNGSTIARIDTDRVDYWHVELESHDILMANDLPAESYLDAGNRGFFEGKRESPDFRANSDWLSRFCRPCVNDGPLIEAVRAQLAARAGKMGWRADVEAGLSLSVDGEEFHPVKHRDAAVFLFPASAREARLRSRVFEPTAQGESDGRKLGLKIFGIALADGFGAWRQIPLDDPRLGSGFYATEGDWRWTDGEALLSAELWAGFTDVVALQLRYDQSTCRGWIAPTEAHTDMQSSETLPRLRVVA